MTWTYHAQRALTGEWLDHNVQLLNTSLTWTLTGPGALTADVDAYTAETIAGDGRHLFDEWSTIIYAEQNDQLKGGWFLESSNEAGEGARSLSCISFAGYPVGRVFTGELQYYVKDAFDLIHILWDFAQTGPGANIGVQVRGAQAGYTIGSADPGPFPVQQPGETAAQHAAAVERWETLVNEPYELAWWNSPDVGNEIHNIMGQAKADYIESHEWANGGDTVNHYIDLHADGRTVRREDLRFVEGENIRVPPMPTRDGAGYYNYIRGLGVGEDRHGLVYEAYGPVDGRVRRDGVYAAKHIMDPQRLAYETYRELRKAQNMLKFDSIEVVEHPNAPIGSWELGDEILVETHTGFEKLTEWMRIIEWTYSPDQPDVASLKLVRPDA